MTEMETAVLRNLVNEVSGALGIARHGIAEAIGWTNVRCIELRLEQAKVALASHAPSEAELRQELDQLKTAYKKAIACVPTELLNLYFKETE